MLCSTSRSHLRPSVLHVARCCCVTGSIIRATIIQQRVYFVHIFVQHVACAFLRCDTLYAQASCSGSCIYLCDTDPVYQLVYQLVCRVVCRIVCMTHTVYSIQSYYECLSVRISIYRSAGGCQPLVGNSLCRTVRPFAAASYIWQSSGTILRRLAHKLAL